MSDYILTQNGELYHYGIKGMKWGVHKKRKDYQVERAAKKQFKRDVKDARKGKYKSDISFTADTKIAKDGSVELSNVRYFQGKKRIGEKKFKELSEYTNKVYSQAEKDTRRGRAITSAILVGSLGLAGVVGNKLGKMGSGMYEVFR